MIDHDTTRQFLQRLGHRVALVGRGPRRANLAQLECRWHTLDLIVADVLDEADSLCRDYRHCYVNLNPIKAELRKLTPPDGTSIRDIYIDRRLWVLVDVDGHVDGHVIPLSEAERQKDALKVRLGPPDLETFSGGGYALLYETDLIHNQATTDRIKLFLQQLKADFLCVDRTVSNAGRLTRLIGTPNNDRPTRLL